MDTSTPSTKAQNKKKIPGIQKAREVMACRAVWGRKERGER